jgi:pimeloyl-ACP methyl ester carboxylesterase
MPRVDVNGAEIHYRVRGTGDPVLGIMGFGTDQRFWAGQIPTVTANNSFITFDNRGTGRSSGTPSAALELLAADAIGLLDHLEVEKAIVFGVSMGGAIAQHIALDHPERVEALILALTWSRPIEFMRRENLVARMLVEAHGSQALVDGTLVRMFTPRFFEMGREAIDQLVAAFVAPGAPELPSAEVLYSQLEAIEKHDVLARLPTITCPTLVIGGKLDVMVPYFASEEISAAIPGARLATFETGHGLMLEEMDALNACIAEFLASIRAPARG